MKIVQLDERRKSNLATISITEDTMNFQTRKIFVLKNKTKQQQKKKESFSFRIICTSITRWAWESGVAEYTHQAKEKKKTKTSNPPPPFPTKEQKRRTTSLNSTNEIQSIVLVDDSLGILYYFFRASFSKRK